MLDEQLAQLPEVVLEAAGSDDLDDATGLGAGVPHRVHLTARLGHVAAGTEAYFTVVRPEADLACQHDGMLILAGVPMRGGDEPDRERMLDDRHLAGLQDRNPDWIHVGHLTYLLLRWAVVRNGLGGAVFRFK